MRMTIDLASPGLIARNLGREFSFVVDAISCQSSNLVGRVCLRSLNESGSRHAVGLNVSARGTLAS
jgi:hypothetical protein